MQTILGIKGNMEARYNLRGHRIPVTVIKAEPNIVVDIKDGKALLGLGARKKVKKPQNDYVAKVGIAPRFVREVKADPQIKIGDKINVSIFSLQDAVRVTGITKGHGFSGGVKRWGFHGGPKTHGQSDRHRAPGSIGQGTTPGRVLKGKHMAGHYGNEKITITGLEVMEVNAAENLLVVKGAVPGFTNGYLIIEKTGKVKKYVAPPEEKPKEDEEEGAKGTDESNEVKKEEKEEKDAK
ncbi:MAG: 50S ribosomal protein L3 [Candidatus Curtissbacteria bacterium]|nr:50S ribosomal protein L3 [Candidatus Curtissbacteria bacterium]MDZ4209690.1 50S ribosomal protein L3 [Candidatus Curtissbacteria bacterium]